MYVAYSTVEPSNVEYHVRLSVEPHCIRVEGQTSTLQGAGAEVGQCKNPMGAGAVQWGAS